MITFYNDGSAGRGYSWLEVADHGTGGVRKVMFQIHRGDQHPDVVLNRAQAVKLMEALKDYFGTEGVPDVMTEGTSIAD